MGLVDSIIGVESGGNPNATNPSSSASGLGQFIDSTWLATLKQARPDLAQGKSDAELLALKTDPQLSRDMTEAYANQNQAVLSKAGVPVTPGSTYLAHFAGPGGAVSVLNADPSTPVSALLKPQAIKSNPFLANMTAGDLRAWADKKMGSSAPQQAPQSQPAQAASASPPAAVPAAPLNIAPQGLLAQQAQGPFAPQAPQQAGLGGYIPQAPQEQTMQAAPIQFVQRRPVNMTALRNAFAQRQISPKG